MLKLYRACWCFVAFLAAVLVSSTAHAQESADGPPLFARVGVLEAPGEGDVQVTITIAVIHRNPWYPRWRFDAGRASLPGQGSAMGPWTSLQQLPAGDREVTAVITLSREGEPLKGPARIRVEVARTPEASKPIDVVEVFDTNGQLGFILPERGVADERIPDVVRSIEEISRRHLEATADIALAEADRPKRFIAVTRCIPFVGYSDPAILEREVRTLLNMGYNTVVNLPVQYADEYGVRFLADADYRPPGVHGPLADEATLRAHYAKRAERYRGAGLLGRLRSFAMSDEPNWDYPRTSTVMRDDAEATQRFRDYLRAKGLEPVFFGAAAWDEVQPALPPGEDAPITQRRLWYHTVRFAAHDQSVRYGRAAEALRQELGDHVMAFTNWNNPGIMLSDSSKWHRGSALTQSHDWFDFSREGGGLTLWLGPGMSESGSWYRSTMRTWSLALQLLRSAADEGVGRFGAYVHHNMIPDDRGYEVALSIMSIAGLGGQGYNSYVWGPYYAFTEYMWSEKFGHYPYAARANRLIARSEHLMDNASPPDAEIALLWPTTSMIYEKNGPGYWTYTTDYLVDMQHVFFALTHHSYPVRIVDEAMIQQGNLGAFKLLYATGPHMERATAEAIRDWVEDGGVLWTSARAGMFDEYDQPMDVLDAVLGVTNRKVTREARDYSPKGGLRELEPAASLEVGGDTWRAYGPIASFEPQQAGDEDMHHRFDNGSIAAVSHRHGAGTSFHIAYMPGLSYSREATEVSGTPTVDYNPTNAEPMLAPIWETDQLEGIERPVISGDTNVETLLLSSEAGKMVTLLNWSATPIDELEVTVANVPDDWRVRTASGVEVTSSRRGDDLILRLAMPEVVDVLLIEAP